MGVIIISGKYGMYMNLKLLLLMLTTKQGENPDIWKNSNAWFNCFKTSEFVQIIINKIPVEKELH